MSYAIHIIGGGRIGRDLADRLEYRGDDVVVVERDENRVHTLEEAGYTVHQGDGTDVRVLEDAGVAESDIVIVAMPDDDANLLAVQLVRERFDPESVVARVNKPDNEEPFADLGIETVYHSDATARMMDLHVESPAMTRWMESVGHAGEVQEVAVGNPDLLGSTVRELDAALPEQTLLVMVGDEGDAHLPDDDEVVDRGDHVTVIGSHGKVREAIDLLSGQPTDHDDPAED